jgi:cation transporter-like permease
LEQSRTAEREGTGARQVLRAALLLHRRGIDPALSAAVILTTLTDLFGFLAFLGLAMLLLL